ncbi:heterokaryon incompatibility protein-domain-containing protein [Alternaria rosae]|uniref:heterokaryon incompatibility protein-domain-containing protein n=1 Tax=Alternaria rosae TaxID=1187941 RepID=UPI001E8CF3D8|nr:heterokaryon incompatibility protein-domain-containing protein [Alternaria rosae]KAH6864733.1 heterokaryon incompatibility protein-domain-containing protein [Alternaria rosae]
MSQYQYSPCSTPTSIRLLAVSGTQDSPSYAIEEVDLADSPRFEALSYTWTDYDNEEPKPSHGDLNPYGSIPISGAGSLRITLHLAGILQHIHGLLVQPESSGKIWIDQIAVNQHDLDERGHQVSLMQRIYGQAERTLMWIGMSIEHTPVLLNLTKELGDLPPLDIFWTEAMHKDLESRLLAVLFRENEAGYGIAQYVQALNWVLGRPYFKRAWIVQEVVLSTRPTMILGTTPSDVSILYRIMVVISYSSKPALQDIHSLIPDQIAVDRLLSMDTARSWLRGDPTRSTLYSDFLDVLFWLSSSREASDPRDAINAFLAFQKNDSGLDLVADYRLSNGQAYRKFCLDMAQRTGSLAFLGLVRGSADPEIPSWTIDWRVDVSSAGDRWQGYRIGDTPHYPYAAAKGRSCQANEIKREGDMRFVARGRIIDTVQSISHITREEIATFGVENVRLAEEMANLRSTMPTVDIGTPAKAGITKERVFLTLLGHDLGPQPRVEPLQYTTAELISMYERFIDTKTPEPVSEAVHKEKFPQMNLRLIHKRLFLGHKHLFGLGPKAIQPGDCICIIHGSTVPLLLRQCENGKEYTVVGQCYYESWMYGEKVDWEEDEADEFVLI